MRPCLCYLQGDGKQCWFCDLAARRPDYREAFEKMDTDDRFDFGANLTDEQRAAMKNLPNVNCCG